MSFTMTTADLTLTDVKGKEAPRQATGYEYSSPTQSIIHEMVQFAFSSAVDSVDLARQFNRPPRQPLETAPLLPTTAGRTTFNGQVVVLEHRDIKAYSAAKPHLAESGSKRIQYTEILRAGNSILDAGKSPKTEKVNSENETPEEAIDKENPGAAEEEVSSEYKIRIIEKSEGYPVLQIRKFKGQAEYEAWRLENGVFGDRLTALGQSTEQGFKYDLTFVQSRDRKADKFIANVKNLKSKIKVRIYDYNFENEVMMSFEGAEFKKWLVENQGYIDHVIRSTDKKYAYDVTLLNEAQEDESPDLTEAIPEAVPSYPPEPPEVTHEIISNTAWVMNNPNFDDKILHTLKKGDKIIVHDENVGPKGKWCEISLITVDIGRRGYTSGDYIKKLEGIGPTAPIDNKHKKSFGKNKAIDTDLWWKKKNKIPYYDDRDAKWKVCLITDVESLNGMDDSPDSVIQSQYKKYLPYGIQLILKENAKQHSPEIIAALIEENDYYDNMARAESFYMEAKSNSTLRVLATLPHKYLKMIPDLTEDDYGYDTYREYPIHSFRETINKVSKKMESYKKDVESYDGEVNYFEAEEEALRVMMITDSLNDMLKKNEAPTGKGKGSIKTFGEKYAIGWKDQNIVYLSHIAKDRTETVLKVGMADMNSKVHMSSRRTQGVLINLLEIENKGLKLGWVEFLNKYIHHPPVVIVSKEDMESLAEREGPVEMTLDQKLAEDRFYKNKDRMRERLEERKKEKDFTGDPREKNSLSSALAIAEGSVSGLYDSVLHNFDLSRIAMAALERLNARADFAAPSFDATLDFSAMKGDYDKIKEELEKAWDDIKGFTADPMSMEFFDDLPTDDILEDWFKDLGDAAESMIYALIIALVESILNMVGNFCPEPDSGGDLGPQNVRDMLPDILPSAEKIADVISQNPAYNKEDMADFLADLAGLLTLQEYCRLLAGTPSDATMSTVMDLLERKYCKLGLDTPAEVKDFFKALGDTGTFDICLPNLPNRDLVAASISPWEQLCPPDGADTRNNVLIAKGLTPEQVDQMLSEERDKTRALAKEILDAFKDGGLLSGSAKQPPTFCSIDEEGNFQAGTASFMDPTFSKEIKSTVDTLFSSVYESFQEEGSEFSQSYIGTRPVEKEVIEHVILNDTAQELKKTVRTTKRVVLPSLQAAYRRIDQPQGDANLLNLDGWIFSLPIGTSQSEISAVQEHLREAQRNVRDFPQKGLQLQNKLQEVKERLNEKIEVFMPSACKVKEEVNTQLAFAQQLANMNTSPATKNFVQITPNRRDDNEERKEECKQQFKFSLLPAGIFMDFRAPEESENNDQPRDIYQQPSQVSGYSAAALTASTVATVPDTPECEDEPIVHCEISVVDKTYLVTKEVGTVAQAMMDSTPYGAREKYSPESMFHQTVKSHLSAASTQAEIDKLINQDLIQDIYVQFNKEIISALQSEVLANKYSKEINLPFGNQDVSSYFLEMIDLGPVATPVCDPHLLKLSQLSNEVLSEFQNDYCVVDNNPGSTNKTPIETSMMRACIKATLRHYLIDFYSRGLFTLTSFKDGETGELIFSYIADKIMTEMSKYGWQYMREFTREMMVIDEEAQESDDVRSCFVRMLKKEYAVIKKGYKKALCVDENKQLTIQERLAKRFGEIKINSLGFIESFGERHDTVIDWITNEGRGTSLEKYLEEQHQELFYEKPFFQVCNQYMDNKGIYYSRSEIEKEYNPENPEEYTLVTSLVAVIPEFSAAYTKVSEMPDYSPFANLHNVRTQGLYSNFMHIGDINTAWSDADRHTLGDMKCYVFPILVKKTPGITRPTRSLEEPAKIRLFTDQRLDTQMLFEYSVPLESYFNALVMHEIESNSRIDSIMMAFAVTRDNLHNLFYTILPETDYWDKTPKELENLPGGPGKIAQLFSLNFGLQALPCIDLKWNFGMEFAGWGFSFKGIYFGIAWKMLLDAAKMHFKNWAEKNDPNIILAKRLSFLTQLACVNISTSDYSMLLSIPWVGNPYMMNAVNLTYNALGLGALVAKHLKDAGDSKEDIERQLAENGFILPDYCADEYEGVLPSLPASIVGETNLEEASRRLNLNVNQAQEYNAIHREMQDGISRQAQIQQEMRGYMDYWNDSYWEDDPAKLDLVADTGQRRLWITQEEHNRLPSNAQIPHIPWVIMLDDNTTDEQEEMLSNVEAGVTPWQYNHLPPSMQRNAVIIMPTPSQETRIMTSYGKGLLDEASARLREVNQEIKRLQQQLYEDF